MRNKFKSFRRQDVRTIGTHKSRHSLSVINRRAAGEALHFTRCLLDRSKTNSFIVHPALCFRRSASERSPRSLVISNSLYSVISVALFRSRHWLVPTSNLSRPARKKNKNCTRELDHFTDKLANGIFIFTYDPALHLPHPLVIKNPDFEFRRVVFSDASVSLSLSPYLSIVTRATREYLCSRNCLYKLLPDRASVFRRPAPSHSTLSRRGSLNWMQQKFKI